MRLDLDQLATRGNLSIPGGRLEVSRLEVGNVQLDGTKSTSVATLSGIAVAAQARIGESRLRLATEGARLQRLALEQETLHLTGLSMPQLVVSDLTLALGPVQGSCPSVQLVDCQGALTVLPASGRFVIDRIGLASGLVRRPAVVLTLGDRSVELSLQDAIELTDLGFEGAYSPSEGVERARLQVGQIQIPGLEVVEAGRRICGDLIVDGLVVTTHPQTVELAQLVLNQLKVDWGQVALAVDRIKNGGLTVQCTEQKELAFVGTGLTLDGLEIGNGSTTIRLGQLTLPHGAALSRGEVRVPELSFEQATLQIDPIQFGGSKGDGAIDLPFLDAINGRLNADITLDVTAPVLGRRRATHPVRLDIEDGTVDFKQLERDLALLESSVLDFELEGDTLILEKDIPLVPFDNTTLVSWHLPDEAERALARRNRVRLRRLLDYRLADSGDQAIEVELHRLELSDIDLSLDLDGLAVIALGTAGEIHLGDDLRKGVLSLIASGALCHDASGAGETTEIALTLQEINGRLPAFSVGGASVTSGEFRLAGVEQATVTFEGFVPRRIAVTVTGGSIRDLCLKLPG